MIDRVIDELWNEVRDIVQEIRYDYHIVISDRVPDELWNEVHDIVQETGIKTMPMEKKCKKAKWLSGEALQISCEKKRSEKQRRKGTI